MTFCKISRFKLKVTTDYLWAHNSFDRFYFQLNVNWLFCNNFSSKICRREKTLTFSRISKKLINSWIFLRMQSFDYGHYRHDMITDEKRRRQAVDTCRVTCQLLWHIVVFRVCIFLLYSAAFFLLTQHDRNGGRGLEWHLCPVVRWYTHGLLEYSVRVRVSSQPWYTLSVKHDLKDSQPYLIRS